MLMHRLSKLCSLYSFCVAHHNLWELLLRRQEGHGRANPFEMDAKVDATTAEAAHADRELYLQMPVCPVVGGTLHDFASKVLFCKHCSLCDSGWCVTYKDASSSLHVHARRCFCEHCLPLSGGIVASTLLSCCAGSGTLTSGKFFEKAVM